MILFWNNARLSPHRAGFDAVYHINYIKYVQEHRALPLPTQGIEMHQPPLFYVLSAVALSSCGLSVTDGSGILVLRLLTTLFGIAHFTLVFLSLRLLLPDRIAPPLVGLLLAAFLPMNLYMSHYCTNETLAALLISASVYFCLRILKTEKNSWSSFGLLGLLIGAAALTKLTAVLAVPFIVSALARQAFARRASLTDWALKIGSLLAIATVVSSWHYIRLWAQTGSLVIGGSQPALGLAYWQDDGYHVREYFLRFGECLVRPLFSATSSFLDGIYSTLWGDGLCGGVSSIALRPPWNYHLMCAGYLLSILPTLLILVGAAAVAGQLFRKGDSERFVLLGLAVAVVCGLIYLNLKVPFYASVKSFYGLCAMIPFGFIGAVGWEFLTRSRRVLQFALGTILLVWAMNSFASFWVRPSVSQSIYSAWKLKFGGNTDQAAAEATKAVNADPSDATARLCLAIMLGDLGRRTEGLEQAQRAVELSPLDSACRLELGTILAKQGQMERAINETRLALKLGPENLPAYDLLSSCLFLSGRPDEAITVAGNGLTVSPFDPELHYYLGLAFAEKEELVTAANQFGYALLLRPAWGEPLSKLRLALLSIAKAPDGLKHLQQAAELSPESPKLLNEVAWLLATYPDKTVRNGDDAVRLAEHACAIMGRKIPALVATLAAAYAETGRFPEAIKTAQEALSLARSSGDAGAASLSWNLLASVQANRPYHEDPKYW